MLEFEALDFGGQSEKCQVGHRLQVVTMASTPWKAERHHCCSQSTRAAIGWKSRVWSLKTLNLRQVFRWMICLGFLSFDFSLSLAALMFFHCLDSHLQRSGLWSRSTTASGGIAGATKIHILRTQNPQPGTSPVKEIEDSAVPWKQWHSW